jgi:pimeloyl-ACP methyl ester carboxylesterase
MIPSVGRHLVDTPAGQVHLRTAGDGGDRGAVVLFHQSPSSSRMWVGVMDHLAAAGFTCAAPDMLDYGHSDAQSRQLTLREHATMLVEAASSVIGLPEYVVGHHTGAVFAAVAGAAAAGVRGVALFGYPLYSSWREKYERLGARIAPDRFDEEGSFVTDLWVELNASIEPETGDDVRHGIYVDRLLAGPLWFTAYVALMATDLEATLRGLAAADLDIRTVFARDDAISPCEPDITAITGTEPIWIDGGPWVTLEHPDRVAAAIAAMADAPA